MTTEPRRRRISRSAALVCVLGACLAAHQHALAQSSARRSLDSHRHAAVGKRIVEIDIPEFSIAEISIASGTTKQNIVTDRRGRYDAFTVSDTQLVVVDRKTGKAREIRGLPFEWRPFSDVRWADSRTLVFDRWSSPHFGVHYAVDIVSGKLVAVVSFHDE